MKKFPWGTIGCISSVMTALIIARCIVTIGRASYYRMDWWPQVQKDPWMIVGILTAVICLVSVVMTFLPGMGESGSGRKRKDEKPHTPQADKDL